ncbi:unnamed protein product [Schistosoma curassoni]|uniref:Uncharacterized protein n=1 Tax=Schistosoma curassoni TaxID=6186 RepID=A0A183KA00_9TREM|nr:unnamed protein product [Schistosoma curassoni]
MMSFIKFVILHCLRSFTGQCGYTIRCICIFIKSNL